MAAIDQMVSAMRASQTASDMMDEAFCDFVGINRTDGRCLDVIDRLGELTAGQLATELGLTTGAVTAMIDRLEAGGLVSRNGDPGDRRKVVIRLTGEAEQVAMQIYGQMAHATAPYLAQLSDGDLLTLISFFEVSRKVNLELAESVRTRTDRRKIPLRQRLEQVKELKEHAKALTKTIKKEAKDWIKVDFLVGGSRWVQDEDGRWVEEQT
ncbi:MAG: MarR family transcriptional regulator [Acidimicrobiia bacterium]